MSCSKTSTLFLKSLAQKSVLFQLTIREISQLHNTNLHIFYQICKTPTMRSILLLWLLQTWSVLDSERVVWMHVKETLVVASTSGRRGTLRFLGICSVSSPLGFLIVKLQSLKFTSGKWNLLWVDIFYFGRWLVDFPRRSFHIFQIFFFCLEHSLNVFLFYRVSEYVPWILEKIK